MLDGLMTAILLFSSGLLFGCILMTVLLVFVVKEGHEILPGHHLHHHGDEVGVKEYDECC